MTSAARG